MTESPEILSVRLSKIPGRLRFLEPVGFDKLWLTLVTPIVLPGSLWLSVELIPVSLSVRDWEIEAPKLPVKLIAPLSRRPVWYVLRSKFLVSVLKVLLLSLGP